MNRICRIATATLLVTALGGCAAAVAPAPAPPLTPGEQAQVLPLMRIEDRRDADVSPVLAAAAAEAPAVRSRAALSLGRLRALAGRDALIRLLQDPDSGVAASAAFALGQLADSAAAPHLAHLLETSGSERFTVAAEAAYALGKLRGEAASRALSGYLAARDPLLALSSGRVEPIASALLGTWRHPRPTDVEFITRWTAAPDPELRWRAAYALVRRPTPAAAPRMLQLAGDPDGRVRSMAMRGITRPLADSAGVADAAVQALLRGVDDADYEVRVNAARSLGTYPRAETVERLVHLLDGEDRHLAVTAAESLGRLGTGAAAAAAPLAATAGDASRPVFLRQTALESLGRVDATRARMEATRLSADGAWRVRVGAARALVAAGAGLDAMRPLTRDSDGRVVAAAVQALVDGAGDTLAPLRSLLIETLSDADLGVRTAAINGLGRLADPATFPLLLDAYQRSLQDEENDARLAALDAIARFERTGATPARAFFARFPRPDDYLLRLRARERFGDASAPWGDPLPLEPRSVAYDIVLERAHGEPAPRVRIETEQGVIDLQLAAMDAPLTTLNFLELAEAGYFDGQEWPRVVPNFVVQGGDPRGDTSGGPGYSIRDEFNRLRYQTGTLGMALSGPDTGGSQWFITHSPQPHLDGAYTIFGQVVAGAEVTRRILPGDRIHRIHRIP